MMNGAKNERIKIIHSFLTRAEEELIAPLFALPLPNISLVNISLSGIHFPFIHIFFNFCPSEEKLILIENDRNFVKVTIFSIVGQLATTNQ